MYVINSHRRKYNENTFILTVDTRLGTGNSFDLPLLSGYNYDFVVDWGDGNTDEIKSYNQAEKLHTYSTGGEYKIKITGVCESWNFYGGGDRLKLTSVDQWGNTGFVNITGAFQGCSNLTSINDTDGTWCSNITNMQRMFQDCSSLAALDVSKWDVSNVRDMGYMFYNCESLTEIDVSNWDVSNVSFMSTMYYMFYNTPLDTPSYDALLIGWSQLPSLKSNVQLHANLAKYSAGAAATARGILTSAPNNWKITDGGQVI